ncbi:flavin-binding monooxygenase [Cordyceps militaris]|uniref:Flavin-binding monooxygenase n=1 Tax=Cordyceps militaris TaxID=73501 RepID=A0A2H4SU63_CORMI|nr:flavin-binding monooxygenase [Cordyceps militaris]
MLKIQGDAAPIGQSSANLLAATYPKSSLPSNFIAETVASAWVKSFQDFLHARPIHPPRHLFFKESYWRDHLCVSWDFHTWRGPEEICTALQKIQQASQFRQLSINISGDPAKKLALTSVDHYGHVRGVQLHLKIETGIGIGKGLVMLLHDAESQKWKAFTIYTALVELSGHEETVGRKRPAGDIHRTGSKLGSWPSTRHAQKNFEVGLQPTALIIGAGQAGLSAAARLTQLGVPCLVIDKQPKLGDCWRSRYLRLVLHDPVWYNHMPYMPFPVSWPVFAPKDKVADFLESYAQLMDLNTWTSSTLKVAKWGGSGWEVEIERSADGGGTEVRKLRTNHIIQATGINSEPKIPGVSGISDFRGPIYHSSEFTAAESTAIPKKVVVVGTGVSGHDIAQEFFEHGHDVTLVQRGATCIDRTAYVYGQGLYSEDGPTTEDADFITHSVPLPVLKRKEIEKTDEHMLENKEYFEALQKAGFRIDRGPDGAGRKFKFIQYAGGSYIDVGALQLIIDGHIKVKQGAVAQIRPHSMLLDNGTELPADEIVFATGFSSMLATTEKLMGNDFVRQLGEVWGVDKEGEMRSIWRQSGHRGYWFAGGNFALCRYYSRLLALQIKAIEEGIMHYEDL